MLRTPKPRNARSKRALEARAPRDYEAAKKAIFVTGPHSSRLVTLAFKDLAALKKPDTIQFNKKNDCLPFESSGAESLEFWSGKNDASLFIVGNHQKKRKDNLIWARCFDGKVLDLLEMGVLQGKAIADFKVSGSVCGAWQRSAIASYKSGTHVQTPDVASVLCTVAILSDHRLSTTFPLFRAPLFARR